MKAAGKCQLVDGNTRCSASRHPQFFLQRKAFGTVPDKRGICDLFFERASSGPRHGTATPGTSQQAVRVARGLNPGLWFPDTAVTHFSIPIASSNARRTSGGWP